MRAGEVIVVLMWLAACAGVESVRLCDNEDCCNDCCGQADDLYAGANFGKDECEVGCGDGADAVCENFPSESPTFRKAKSCLAGISFQDPTVPTFVYDAAPDKNGKNPTTLCCSTPTTNPTVGQVNEGTCPPTESPTESPGAVPTESPTSSPTDFPTDKPTPSPTDFPTDKPTDVPTLSPSFSPIINPTDNPTDTFSPTSSPVTSSPTDFPIVAANTGGKKNDDDGDGNEGDNNEEDNETGVLVGGVMGGVALLAAIGFIIVFRRSQVFKGKPDETEDKAHLAADPRSSVPPAVVVGVIDDKPPTNSEIGDAKIAPVVTSPEIINEASNNNAADSKSDARSSFIPGFFIRSNSNRSTKTNGSGAEEAPKSDAKPKKHYMKRVLLDTDRISIFRPSKNYLDKNKHVAEQSKRKNKKIDKQKSRHDKEIEEINLSDLDF